MTWQVMRDLKELYEMEPYRETVKLEEIDRAKKKRYKKEVFRKQIHNYLRKNQKWIDKLTKEDIAILTEWMDDIDRTMFLDQVKYTLETTYGKPIKRIIQNNKSVLFTK